MFQFSFKGAAIAASVAASVISAPAIAHDDHALPSPLGHAPIGVMGDHRHNQGEWMLGYRYMQMNMSGNRDGTTDLSPSEVRTQYGFGMVPLEMQMDMHMFGVMYGWSNGLTVVASVPYIRKNMKAQMPSLATVRTTTDGFGDAKLTALQKLTDTTHAIISLSLPTGSINEKNDAGTHLPYPMQLGSGTYDLKLGVHWSDFIDAVGKDTKFGAQVYGIIRNGKNDNGYRLGNQAKATVYANHQLTQTISVTGRLSARAEDEIHGVDRKLTVLMAPASDPANHGGEWVDAGIGINYVIPGGPLKGQRLAAEYQLPLYQNLNGPKLQMDNMLTVGWQWAF